MRVRNIWGESARRAVRFGASIALSSLSAVAIGCGAFASPGDAGSNTLDPNTLGLSAAPRHLAAESGGDLVAAESVAVSTDGLIIDGEIESPADVDVFELGPAEPGDRVRVEMHTAGSLNGAISLMDGDGVSLLVNDHRNVYLGRKGPFIDLVIRRPTSQTFVAVASTPGAPSTGAYALEALLESPKAIPESRPNWVLLNFKGGKDVRIGGRPAIDVPSFDASGISEELSGLTDEIMARIVELVRDDFAPYDVTLLSTSEGAHDDGGMTQLFFGSYDPALLGVAEGVDEYNADAVQSAIVFTDTFSEFMAIDPSLDQLSQAIANVASHEIGHLLGLVHTSDPRGIMDVTASLSELALDQTFIVSPIYAGVFPIGYQDDVQLLLDGVGGDPVSARKAASKAAGRFFGAARSDQPKTPARSRRPLSRCGLQHQ